VFLAFICNTFVQLVTKLAAEFAQPPTSNWTCAAENVPAKVGCLFALPVPPPGIADALIILWALRPFWEDAVIRQPPHVNPIDRVIDSLRGQ